MKKYRFLVLVSLLVTALFTSNGLSSQLLGAEVPLPSNTIYLNLTKIGLLDGQPGVKIPEVYLEYGHQLTLSIGATLPSENVTSITGAFFIGWVIQSPTGGLQKITTMPSRAELILQAHFDHNGASTSEPGTSEPPTSGTTSQSEINPGTGLFIQQKNSGTFLSQYELEENGLYGDSPSMEYRILNLEVTAGFEFYFATNNDISGSGATILPSYQSTNNGEIGYTFSGNPTINTMDYLQTSGQTEGGGVGQNWFKFLSPAPLGSLVFKTSGTFDFYVVFWNNFGWAQIFMVPSA